MKKTRYILIEGLDGAGKTTQVTKLVEYLKSKGKTVLQTKEPGTSLSPLTMKLRGIMLDAQYEPEMTMAAREFISQAIRSIHLEKVVLPALNEYDFVIQDRGVLSGYAYAHACGLEYNDISDLKQLVFKSANINPTPEEPLYTDVVFLGGDPDRLLARARGAKQEFAAGDAIEAKGNTFARQVAGNFEFLLGQDDTTVRIDVENKSPDEVFAEMLVKLNLG